MPVQAGWQIVTLGEGGTPLLPAPHLSERTGCEVCLKVDGANPTGSFKDRGMTVAVTDALARGKQGVLCASTGNTSASAAAYAARAGLTCAVLVPQGKIALGKLAQAVAHGARILQIDGNFDDCLELARKTAADYDVAALVNSVNPTRIAGQASAAYEICDELGRAPDVHCLPVGNAGNITAYWAGYSRLPRRRADPDARRGCSASRPPGAAPLVHGAPVTHPETIATAIRIGAPASWAAAVTARDASGGRFAAVTDDEILAAYRLLSAREAVFVEPASAASVAGLLQSAADGTLPRGSLVVCTVTGHGLKDPDTALLTAPEPDGRAARPGAPVADPRWSAVPESAHPCSRRRMGRPTEVRVRVPASSANLGPGFDALGPRARPLRRHRGRRSRRTASPSRSTARARAGCPATSAHLVVRAMRTTWAVTGDAPTGLRMRCRNAIPHSRGLGSSAAAAVGGAVAAVVLAGPRRRAGARHDPAGHGRYGGPRRQRGRQPARRVRRRVGDAGEYRGAVPRCTARRAPGHPSGRVRRGSRVAHQHHTGAAARSGAAGRRGLHRQPHRTLGAGLHPAS